MTTISSSITFNPNATLADVTQSIEDDLKAKGVEGKVNQDALVLTKLTNSDGTFTVFYQYPLDKPNDTPPGSLNDAFNKLDGFIDLGAILALFHEVALEQRDAAREGRQAQLNVQVTELKNAAQDIRDSAVAAFVGAMIMGAMSIAGGILSVAGSIKAGAQAKAGQQEAQTATQLSSETTPKTTTTVPQTEGGVSAQWQPGVKPSGAPTSELQIGAHRGDVATPKPETTNPHALEIQSRNQLASNLSQLSQTTLGRFQGWSSLATGIGGVGKGIGDYISTQEQANSKEDEARATKAGGQRDELIAYQNEAQQLMADIRQMLQQITQNQMETARAILRV